MKNVFVLGIGVLLFWSCGNPEKATSAKETEIHTEAHEANHYNESSDPLELNDGERWVVNEEMKPFVAKQEELLNTYTRTNQTDHQELASQLQEQNELLIQSCTMTGKSHDELHKWLHPHMETVQALGEAESQEEAEKIHADLKQSIDTYHTYFQ